jgi:threonine/homoserine/homoserine lactone efflux protein
MQANFAEFLLAAIVMEITPGPNMTWLALLSAREGRTGGLMAVAGIASGLAILALVAAMGAAALITAWPPLYEILRWGGVLFLLYLAYEAWRDEKNTGSADLAGKHFWRGLVVNLLNPKAAAVYIVMIPSFAGPTPANTGALITMTLAYLAIATAAHVLIVLFAATFQKALADPRRERIVRRIFAVMLAAIAIWFAFTSGRALP